MAKKTKKKEFETSVELPDLKIVKRVDIEIPMESLSIVKKETKKVNLEGTEKNEQENRA